MFYKLNFYNTVFVLPNHKWPDGTYINNDYINIFNFAKERLRIDNSDQRENT